MRGRLVVLLVVVVLAPVALAGCQGTVRPRFEESRSGPVHTPGQPSHRPASAIERRPAGTDAWKLDRPADNHQIEGYALATDVAPGEPVALRVSTTARRFRVEAYRLGWFRGGLGHLTWRSAWLPGRSQPTATFSDPARRTVVAPWRDSLTVPTAGWAAGAYLLRLDASSGWQSYVPLFVRSAGTAGTVALVAPVATWQAYNDWGGYSLYTAPAGRTRSYAVSFDRPYAGQGLAVGAADMLYGVLPVVVEAARAGVAVSYLTDLDIDADPGVLAGARAYVSMGHDEYWTPAMRASVLAARGRGTNLAFLGADTAFWRVRLHGAPTGVRRVVVGYRWAFASDPLTGQGSARATAPFEFPPHARPQETLTGTRYECYPVDAPYTVTSPGWWGYAGTGVRRGARFSNLVGIEADRVYPTPTTPRPLQIVASTDYRCGGVPTSAQSVYFTTSSGAGVFTAGTLRWTCALLGACGRYPVSAATRRFTDRVTENVLRAFAAGPAGRGHPAQDNLDAYHLSTRHSVPAD